MNTPPTFAQHGQDRWILQQFPVGFRGFACDVGAYDGVTHSNTMLLELMKWSVLCIEANPIPAATLKKHRIFVQQVAVDAEPKDSATLHIHAANVEAYTSLRPTMDHQVWRPEKNAQWLEVPVPVKTLDQCLEAAEFPRLDLLTIDVEGTERDVLKGFDIKRWNPGVIVLEAWDQGALDDAILPHGYLRVNRMLVDDCYVRQDLWSHDGMHDMHQQAIRQEMMKS